MFSGCGKNKDDKFTMNNVFTLPGGTIESIGSWVCRGMFAGCKNDAFTMGAAFTLGDIVIQEGGSIGGYFCETMFSGCSGPGFLVNEVFRFPQLSQDQVNSEWAFSNAFNGVTKKQEGRSAIYIINGTPEPSPGPSSPRHTFGGGVWPDYGDLASNWK
jgi:hypothetical protein